MHYSPKPGLLYLFLNSLIHIGFLQIPFISTSGCRAPSGRTMDGHKKIEYCLLRNLGMCLKLRLNSFCFRWLQQKVAAKVLEQMARLDVESWVQATLPWLLFLALGGLSEDSVLSNVWPTVSPSKC